MGRFKYVPQSFDQNDNGKKSMLESESFEINIKEEGEYIDNTIVVYDDYKIPIDITEELAKDTLMLKNTIESMYETMEKLDKLIDETSDIYDTFENHVFGKVPYSYKYGGFDYIDEEHSCKPLEWNGRAYSKSSLPLEFEIQKLDYAKSANEYNKAFLQSKDNLINPLIYEQIDNINSQIDNFHSKYSVIKSTLIDESFWEVANISMINQQDKIEKLKRNIEKMAVINVYCPELEEGDIQ